ncbi:MAG TPA: cell wall-binding repeat-containing protein [Solirubrobacteraceae bacterium]|nr:cell wall-binding repeat-containing protein [Solirubrobacteraceae bacterium]
MRRTALILALAALAALAAAGCSGKTELIRSTQTVEVPVNGIQSHTPQAGQKLGFPTIATKNTTRVAGADPVADAAGVALAVYPSAAAGTHPQAVVIAPTDDWEAALASSVLMASPLRAPLLLSPAGKLPSATSDALGELAPTGAGPIDGAQVIRVGDVPVPSKLKATAIAGRDPASLAAAIDRFASAAAGHPSPDVVIASTSDATYAMPAAGWAAESGDPILFVTGSSVPAATAQALVAHQHPHIYVLGPPSIVPDSLLKQLGRYGTVKRVGAQGADANSVAFATYRDPPCAHNQPCVHVPGSFGWALTSPGHGYTLLNAGRPLDAAAAAPLSASGTYGPELVIENANQLPSSVLNYFLNYATPGYTQEGPTAAVYNHGWVIGDQTAVSVAVQAEMDSLLEVVPQR